MMGIDVFEYVYLGHNIKLGKENQIAERRRIGLMWAVFNKLSHILKHKKVPINLKRKVYEACVLSCVVAMYGVEIMILTQENAEKLRVTQRFMEKAMPETSLRD